MSVDCEELQSLVLDETTGEFLHCEELQSLVLDEATGEFRAIALEKESTEQLPVRKRKRKPEKWKRNVRKSSHQSGQMYESSRGKIVPAREVKTTKDCFSSCKFNCSKLIEHNDRLLVFRKYYDMTQNEKYFFILETTERRDKKRITGTSNIRKYSYFFYVPLKGGLIRVCKRFYLGTLDISQKVVYGTHSKKDSATGTPGRDNRGKHGKQKNIVSQERKDFLREHIASFPHVDSHYCRASSSRKYLEPHLNISKMYELYTEACLDKGMQPLKKSTYYKTFNQEFNLSFFTPKKDLCDLCSQWEMETKEGIITADFESKYQKHAIEKKAMRVERNKDRESGQDVLCFDLQNVISCPKADVSCFFYHSKINVYNLTGHFSKTKKVYCVIWVEVTSGRTGNDLASALHKLLEAVYADNEDITELILWSDSCVPQNRNSMVSYAILDFLKSHETVAKIQLKYCTPGHSAIQEVDAAHSALDRVFSVTDFYSPVSLLKVMLKANKKNPYKIVQMQNTDFKNYGECAKLFKYDNIPFCSVTSLLFTQHYFKVSYCMSHADMEWNRVDILSTSNRARRNKGAAKNIQYPILPEPKVLKNNKTLPENKLKSIKAMLKFMPLLDREYYKAVLKI